MFKRITVNPKICQGQSCIRGLRITVNLILKLLATGKNPQQIIDDYPELEMEDINEAIKYAPAKSASVFRGKKNSSLPNSHMPKNSHQGRKRAGHWKQRILKRDTITPAWDRKDPRRLMSLMETPWEQISKGRRTI